MSDLFATEFFQNLGIKLPQKYNLFYDLLTNSIKRKERRLDDFSN